MSKLAIRCYKEIIQRFGSCSDIGWMAGVLLNGCQPGRRLSNMLDRLNAGQEMCTQSFLKPTKGFILNGICVSTAILHQPVTCRIEDFRYVADAPRPTGWTCIDTSCD